jgi:DNA-binding NarL/FixJ family response regulator
MRVVLADDHALFRDGVASLLAAWGHEVVGSAGDGEQAVALVEALVPDVVLMDVSMPRLSGVEATRRLAASRPDVAIVMLTVSEDEADLFAAVKAGARGYLLKNLEADQLRGMLEAVARGEAAITPATAARILAELHRPDPGHGFGAGHRLEPDRLTERERDVLTLVTAGLRNKEIAARLGISENTVKYHLKNILEKLHAGSRTEVATLAVRQGLIRGE